MKLYLQYFSMLVRCQMQYKFSFWMMVVGHFFMSFSLFFSIFFLFSRFGEVDGFTFPEILLCFAVVSMAFSSAECFARGFDVFPRLIKSGDLDRILLRPRSVIFQVLCSNIEFSRLGRFLQALLILIYAVLTSGFAWSFDKIIALFLMLTGGFVTFSGLFILYAAFSFFTIDGLEFMNIFTDGAKEFGRYPFSVYGEGILKFLTFGIPLALFQYYPLLYLTGRSDRIGLIFLPLIGFLFLIPCYAFFRFGLRRYQSVGS